MDLVVGGVPLEERLLSQQLTVMLARAVLPVLLRREFALTRRLHGWLLGGGEALGPHAQTVLISALIEMLQQPKQVQRRQRGQRVLAECAG